MCEHGSFGAAGIDQINTLDVRAWVFNDNQVDCEERTRRCGAGSSEAFCSAWMHVCAELLGGVRWCARQAAVGVELSEAGWFLLEQI